MSNSRTAKPPHELVTLISKNRALEYLNQAITDSGYQSNIGSDIHLNDLVPSLIEVFTSILALNLHANCCKNSTFVAKLIKFLLSWHNHGIFHFFQNLALLPADVDCTSMGLSVLLETGNIDKEVATAAADKILKNTNRRGCSGVF